MFDSIIIGKGPAGISCAIYLKRYNLNPLVIGYGYGALEANTSIENYYGIKQINGRDLVDASIAQANDLGIDVLSEEVLSITYTDCFNIKTKNNVYQSKTVFLATGKNRSKIKANNLKEFEGKGISYCATCDGFFYRKKKIAVIGSKDFMIEELEVLKNFTNDILIFTNNEKLENEVDFPVINEKIVSFVGNDNLEKIVTENSEYNVDAAFIAIGSAQALDFCAHLGIEIDELKNIVVDSNFMTNLPGVFAGGDVIGGLLQVSKAVSDGANAAVKIKQYITKKGI